MATTTPNYGWDVPTSTDYVKDGATAIETLGDDIDASLFSITGGKNVGLMHLTTQTFTAQTNFIISNVFSSAYDNYVIDVKLTAATGSNTLAFQLRTGSTTLTTGYASNLIYGSGGANGVSRAGSAFYSFGQMPGDFTHAMLADPFATRPTAYQAISQQGASCGLDAGYVNNTTSYESLVITNVLGGTNTGTVRIYGVRN